VNAEWISFRGPNFLLTISPLQVDGSRLEIFSIGGHQPDLASAARLDHLPALFGCIGERFLAEHVLPGFSRAASENKVRAVVRGNVDGFDLGVSKAFFEVVVGEILGGAKFAGEASCFGQVAADESNKPRLLRVPERRKHGAFRNVAETDNSIADALRLSHESVRRSYDTLGILDGGVGLEKLADLRHGYQGLHAVVHSRHRDLAVRTLGRNERSYNRPKTSRVHIRDAAEIHNQRRRLFFLYGGLEVENGVDVQRAAESKNSLAGVRSVGCDDLNVFDSHSA